METRFTIESRIENALKSSAPIQKIKEIIQEIQRTSSIRGQISMKERIFGTCSIENKNIMESNYPIIDIYDPI